MLITCGAELADCIETTIGSVVSLTVTSLLKGETRSTVIKMIVDRTVEEGTVALHMSMQAKSPDVYHV